MSTKDDAGNGDDGLPEDFFDDFSNADFMDGLNVVDAWDDKQSKWNDDDLRDLLRSRKQEAARDDKPGNRRDIAKTQRDILKDKQSKVREHIAKRLDSPSGPPGTELDDFENQPWKKRRIRAELNRKRSPIRITSPPRCRSRSPRRRRSPSPRRRSPRRRSPPRRHRSRSKSPQRSRHSRSPRRRSPSSRHNYATPQPSTDDPNPYPPPAPAYSHEPYKQYPMQGFPPAENYYPPSSIPGPPAYYGGHGYVYPGSGGPMGPPIMVPPMYGGAAAPAAPMMVPPAAPMMVPPAALASPVPVEPPEASAVAAKKPEPLSLEQLLKDGKISTQDYHKLKPKSRPDMLDLKEKVNVLSRCHDAIVKLAKLHLPNRLVMSSLPKTSEQKAITPKYCSPLKRQPIVVFRFTSPNSSAQQSNKQLVDSIVATIGLEKVLIKPSKKDNFNMRDASVQTTSPFCESCEIRQLTRSNDVGTSVDRGYFSTSAHTQVIESELASSKITFTPVGNVPDTSAMSLSHLTPAQLIVSQLAARAKKLEPRTNEPRPSEDLEYMRRHDNSYYGGQNYQNNYRY